jgi:hypothetical protein
MSDKKGDRSTIDLNLIGIELSDKAGKVLNATLETMLQTTVTGVPWQALPDLSRYCFSSDSPFYGLRAVGLCHCVLPQRKPVLPPFLRQSKTHTPAHAHTC